MSLSLVAVFIPILLMGGIVGRLFREFAVTLSAAIMVSLLVSLTLTPMMCAHILKHKSKRKPRRRGEGAAEHGTEDTAEQRLKPGQSGPGRALRSLQSVGERFWDGYKKSLSWALRHSRFMMLLLAITIGLNFYLYTVVQKGFFPQQDTGQLLGFFRVDQGSSFTSLVPKLEPFEKAIRNRKNGV